MSDDQDLLSQAENEINNSLQPGTCCDQTLKGLRFQIIALLNCDACQDMLFQIDNIRISGSLYRGVAYALADPRHTLHLSSSPKATNVNGTVFDAKYDSDNDRLTFPFREIGGKPSDQSYRCQTIIHECTHACLDLAQTTVSRLGSELACYFASVLFLKGQGLAFDPITNFGSHLSSLADQALHLNVKHIIYTMPSKDIGQLKSALMQEYKIANDFQDTGDAFKKARP